MTYEKLPTEKQGDAGPTLADLVDPDPTEKEKEKEPRNWGTENNVLYFTKASGPSVRWFWTPR